jgi:hypothetical protein
MLALEEPACGRGRILSAGFITENKEETIRLYTFINSSSIILTVLEQQFIQPTHRILLHTRQHM